MEKSVRITDIIFFIVIFVVMGILILSATFGFKLPIWFQFWWVVMLPLVIIKIGFPKSKLAKWFEKKRW